MENVILGMISTMIGFALGFWAHGYKEKRMKQLFEEEQNEEKKK